eukprot:2206133-Amphidinium_carterae.2
MANCPTGQLAHAVCALKRDINTPPGGFGTCLQTPTISKSGKETERFEHLLAETFRGGRHNHNLIGSKN